MKKLLYTAILTSSLLACRSIDKMVEQGRYDDAIFFATEKLAGKKNKKTKHVKGLEEAFYKITERDLDHIARLDGQTHPHNWEEVLTIVDKIDRRQNRVAPFLPLISKDGYEAHFRMIDTKAISDEATLGAADFHYGHAMELLTRAYTDYNKNDARQAYEALLRARRFRYDHKDIAERLAEAESLGITRVLVETKINTDGYVSRPLSEEIRSIDLAFTNSKWRKFYAAPPADKNIDINASLEIRHIEVSPERETISHHTDSKRVEDGFRYERNKKGEFKKDTTGKRIRVKKYKTVHAEVTEILREKSTFVEGMVKLKDANGQLINSHPLTVEIHFNDRSSNYLGDKRALCTHDVSRKRTPLVFPHDAHMIADASAKLKYDFIESLHDIRI